MTAPAIPAGTGTAVFALAALAALAIGRWRRLGDQGTRVATAAFFAFSVFVTLHSPPEFLTRAAEILAVVLTGSAIGVAVNLVLLPPLRLRGTARGVAALDDPARLLDDLREADEALTASTRGHH
ncbi:MULTISPECIES: hypothetical protein [unclassified Nocardiopsis]|uniref:hypothetical protein n=1 Tax=Nocardiopsis TaxID=2013 RepID=UPI00387B8764